MSWQEPEKLTPANRFLITVAVMAGTFMEIVDTTVVNVALPHIAGNLSAATDEATWVLTSYLVANAIVLPITGWLAALFGRKRFLMLCLALFTGSSMLCGFSTSLGMLVFFRVLQGLGGGGLQPVSQAILLETYPVERRGMAMALWGIGVIFAPIIGPLLGGWLTDNYSWRWAFYINFPVGVVSLFLTALVIFDPPYIRAQRASRIDYLGLALLSVGLGTLQVVLDKGEREDWFNSAFIVRLSVISAVALILLVYRQLTVRDPVVDLRLFKERTYASGVVMVFFVGFVLYGSVMLLPLFLQTLMGYDAVTAGWALAYGGMASLLVMPLVGRLTMVVDNRWLIAFGLLLNALSVYLMRFYNLQIDFATAWHPRFIQGIGLAFVFVPLTTLTMSRIPPAKMGNATGIFNLMRNLGGSFGISTATTLLAQRSQWHQSRLVEHLTPWDYPFQQWLAKIGAYLGLGPEIAHWQVPQALGLLYQETIRQAQMIAYCETYLFFTLIFLLLLPLLLVMRRVGRPAGPPVAGH